MNDFLQSKLIKDLENGQLPEVKLSITPETVFNLAAAAFFVAVSVLIVSQIFKKLG